MTNVAGDFSRIAALATQIRRDVMRMIVHAGSGHPGGALGIADVMALLYGHLMQHSASNPTDPNRDRLVLSNGHICAAWYSALSLFGYLSREELATHRRFGSRLQGHPARAKLGDLVETSSGPLGQGLSVANGIAMAMRLNGHSGRVFCILGDGEMHEGIVWESLLSAAHHRLGKVNLVVSDNGLQIDGRTAEIKGIEPLDAKLAAFGWEVHTVDGHNLQELADAFEKCAGNTLQPGAVIAKTIMSKGVAFMEDDARWHGACPSEEECKNALALIGPADGFSDFPITKESQ